MSGDSVVDYLIVKHIPFDDIQILLNARRLLGQCMSSVEACPNLLAVYPIRSAIVFFVFSGCSELPYSEIESSNLLSLDFPHSCAAVTFTPDSSAIAWSYGGPFKGTIRYTSIRTGELIKEFDSHGFMLSFTRDSKTLAAHFPHTHSFVQFRDPVDGKVLGIYTFYDSYSTTFSSDGSVAALGSKSRIGLCRVPNGEEIIVLRFDRDDVVEGFIRSMRFLADDRLLMAAHGDGLICTWDIQAQKIVSKIDIFDDGRQNRVILSPNSQIAAGVRATTMTAQNSITLYSTKDATMLTTLTGHSDGVTSMCFSPDSTHIASTSEDLTVRIWRVATGKQLREIRSTRRNDWKRKTIGGDVRIWVDRNGNYRSCELTGLVFSSCGKKLAWIERERINEGNDIESTIRIVKTDLKLMSQF